MACYQIKCMEVGHFIQSLCLFAVSILRRNVLISYLYSDQELLPRASSLKDSYGYQLSEDGS